MRKRENYYKHIYEKCGDYLILNLISDPEPEGELRKLGLMRKSYLENHRRGIYSGGAVKVGGSDALGKENE